MKRDLPWRRNKDPYRVWVSEIMLQQTRVAAVIPYFERFLERFPHIDTLAKAPEQDVLQRWSGLGYYSRARNLQKAAKEIASRGAFPEDYEPIRALPGVGAYTAAAIASIAFDLPYAVLDGNVRRVLSRLTGENATMKRLQTVASELLDRRCPGEFNQAMMELGATVCLPKLPQCPVCPVSDYCEGLRAGKQNELPVKARRKEPVAIEDTILIVERSGKILMRQRSDGESRLASFWELPSAGQLPGAVQGRQLGSFRHSITHHNFVFSVATASIHPVPKMFQWVSRSLLDKLPLTTVTRKTLRLYYL